VILEDTGHVPMIERPALFNRLVEDFLERAPEARSTGL
jgi:pimeloyl-ACP methyl ester carboxylesterase